MTDALAYYNYGRWVADCPTDGCSDAVALHPVDRRTGLPVAQPQVEQVCANGHPLRFVLPDEKFRTAVEQELAKRESDADRAWLPDGHPWGAIYGHPCGQSIEDLEQESREVAALRAEQRAVNDSLRTVLADAGIEVGDDGSFAGKLEV